MEPIKYRYKIHLTNKDRVLVIIHTCQNLMELHNFLLEKYPKWKVESIIGG